MSKFISNLVQQILDAAYIVRTVGLEAPDDDADEELAMAVRSLRGKHIFFGRKSTYFYRSYSYWE